MFKPLFSTKDKGNGLGLSISYRLIQAQNGLLSYLPRNPKGSILQIIAVNELGGLSEPYHWTYLKQEYSVIDILPSLWGK